MSSTNKTTYYELSQYVGSDKPTYLGDYNSDMLKIDTGLHVAANAADTAVTTANTANSTATSASTTASTALSTAQTASATASQAQTTAETALTNSGAAQTAAEEAETAARANTITNLAPAYDPTLTYDVDDLVTYIDSQGSGKLYKCIVAVTTPEAFNINKWDDATTSEVYQTKRKIVATVNGDGISSRNAILAGLLPYLQNLNDATLLGSVVRMYNDEGTFITYYKYEGISYGGQQYNFSRIAESVASSLLIRNVGSDTTILSEIMFAHTAGQSTVTTTYSTSYGEATSETNWHAQLIVM